MAPAFSGHLSWLLPSQAISHGSNPSQAISHGSNPFQAISHGSNLSQAISHGFNSSQAISHGSFSSRAISHDFTPTSYGFNPLMSSHMIPHHASHLFLAIDAIIYGSVS
jgi:hypothetical protein